jgi:hypothetical protein
MKIITEFLTKIFTKSNKIMRPLGRWNMETCPKKINNKIDLSNEDHCGPCGQYAIEKIKYKKNIDLKKS